MTTALYAWTALTMSILAVALGMIYLVRIVRVYRQHHDERAAVSLGKAVGLLVVAVGFTLSALGAVTESADLILSGLSVGRGALVAILAALVLSNVRSTDA